MPAISKTKHNFRDRELLDYVAVDPKGLATIQVFLRTLAPDGWQDFLEFTREDLLFLLQELDNAAPAAPQETE